MPLALVFDCDGVIADSETLANRTLADLLTRCGAPTTLAQSLATYVGKQPPEIVTTAEALHDVALPADFAERLLAETIQAFDRDLTAVPGVGGFIRAFAATPKAVASSSPPARLQRTIDLLGFADAFGRHVYSASLVPRGKPHPDIFLYAARAIGAAREDCVVLEDSPSGVMAGVAAGMRVVGVLAGGHIGPGHAARLAEAGAWRIARNFEEAEAFCRRARESGAD
ncbi:MAG: HAD family phosphatase [Alphaproteobacteria bacterium]